LSGRLALAGALSLLSLALVHAASASAGYGGRTIDIHPGPNAIQRAIDRANSGDRLRIHEGRYREALTIEERLKLTGARRERRPLIDGSCETLYTIAVRHRGVALEGLKVVGAAEGSEVDFSGVASGRAEDMRVRDTCDAEYGINVYLSEDIDLVGNRAGRGFSDAGLYVGAVSDTGGGVLSVRDNEAFGNNRGIIVENSAGGDIRLRNNYVHDNTRGGEGEPTGIFLHNGDGVLIGDNRVSRNGTYGIHLDSNSDGNELNDNTVRGNPTDILDEGSGNCGSGNASASGDPIPPC
jgi:parallel beta-helix repeat protein